MAHEHAHFEPIGGLGFQIAREAGSFAMCRPGSYKQKIRSQPFFWR
jgi:hypothetical protein